MNKTEKQNVAPNSQYRVEVKSAAENSEPAMLDNHWFEQRFEQWLNGSCRFRKWQISEAEEPLRAWMTAAKYHHPGFAKSS